MPLQRQSLPVPFAQGLDTKTDPKQVSVGKQLVLQNAEFTSPLEFRKTQGYEALTTNIEGGGGISNGVATATFFNEIVELDGSKVYSYSEEETLWYGKGQKTTCSIGVSTVAAALEVQAPKAAVNSTGNKLYAYFLGSTFTISLIDGQTNFPYLSNIPLSITPSEYMVSSIGDKFVIFFDENPDSVAPNTFSYIIVDPQTGAQSPQVDLVSTHAGEVHLCFSIATNTNGSVTFLFGYINNTFELYSLDTSTTSISILNTASFGTPGGSSEAPAVVYDSANNFVWVSFCDTSGVEYSVLNATTFASILGTTLIEAVQVQNIIGALNSSGLVVFYEFISPPVETIRTGTGTIGGATTNGLYLPYGYIESTPVKNSNGDIFFLATSAFLGADESSGVLQPVAFLVKYLNASSYEIAAKILPGEYLGGSSILIQPVKLSTNLFEFPVLRTLESFQIPQQTSLQQAVGSTVDFSVTPENQTIANNLHFTGGYLSAYDGALNVESGWFLFPDNLSALANQGSGGGLSIGTYQYSVVYEYYDNFGQLQQSAPSIPISVNQTMASKKIALTIPILYFTNKPFKNVNIGVYRTAANGTVFFKVGLILGSGLTFGDKTTTFTDGASDTQIEGNPQLYTTGGEVENIQPPASDIITQYKNRIILIPSENPLEWWYSKQVIQGSPVEFNDTFTSNVDQRGGNITAVAVMDDKLLLFKSSNIFYVVGDGPAPNGTNNDFSYPQLVNTDKGCINPASVISSGAGVFFQASNGIYLLDRGLNVSYVGAPVEEFGTIPITSARLIPNTTQIRFTLNSGICLFFDYFVNQWSVRTALAAVDSTIYKNNFTYLQSDGLIKEETPGTFSDNGSNIQMSVTTGWLNFAGVQGFERIYYFLILGEYKSPHNLTISISYDFDDTVVQTTTASFPSSVTPYQLRIFPQRQKCEAMKITITDTPLNSPGESASLSGLNFLIGLKSGTYKLNASQSFG